MEKTAILAAVGGIHAAIVVAFADIAFVEQVILGFVIVAQDDLDIPVELADPLLAAAGTKVFTVNTKGLAGMARRAVGTIDVVATAAKTGSQQSFVTVGVEQIVIHQHQQLLLFMVQITAGMLGGQPYFEDHFFSHKLISPSCQQEANSG